MSEEKILGLDENEEQMFTLYSSYDKSKKFEIRKSYLVNLSHTIKKAVETDKETDDLELDLVDPATLETIIYYLNDVRKGKVVTIGLSDLDLLPPEERKQKIEENEYSKICFSRDMIENLPDLPDDVKFIDSINKGEQLNNLVNAANYLGIFTLLHLCCMKIASLINGVNIENIKRYLEEKDFVAPELLEEEKQV